VPLSAAGARSLGLAQRLRARLAAGAPCFGTFLMLRDPAAAECLADAGLDWLAVDMEHSPITVSEAADLIRAGSGAGCPVLVRLPDHQPALIKQVLDAGAAGVIAPDVRSVDDVTRLARALRYPDAPTSADGGRGGGGGGGGGGGSGRGVGMARAQGYGRAFNEYVSAWNRAGLLIVLLEHVDAVAAAAAIAVHPAVDVVFVGPYDLSASLGLTGQLDHPAVADGVQRLQAAARAAGKPLMAHAVAGDPAVALRRREEGVQMIGFSADAFMIRFAVDQFVAGARACDPRPLPSPVPVAS